MKKGGRPKAFKLKNTPRLLWDEFVYGSHLVALGDVSALLAFSVILKININLTFFLVIYLSIIAINFLNRYEDAEDDINTNLDRYNSVSKYFKFMKLIMLVLFGLSFLITYLNAPFVALIFMILLFGIGVLYSIMLKNITRKIVGFKNIMTALPYALLVIFLALYNGAPITLAVVSLTVFYFIRMSINTVYFDIKDIKSDEKSGLMTFPVIFGERRTKNVLQVTNIFSAALIISAVLASILPVYALWILITLVYPFIYLNLEQSNFSQTTIYNVIADGEFIFWSPYILLGRILVGL